MTSWSKRPSPSVSTPRSEKLPREGGGAGRHGEVQLLLAGEGGRGSLDGDDHVVVADQCGGGKDAAVHPVPGHRVPAGAVID